MAEQIGAGVLAIQGGLGPVIIDAWSGVLADPLGPDARPFVLAVQTAAGGPPGPFVSISVRRSARLCLFGDWFQCNAYNLSTDPNPVTVRAYPVAAMLATANVFEQGVTLAGAGSYVAIPVPSLARTFRWDVPQSEKASVYVELVAGYPGLPVVGRYAWDEQPSEGVPVGGLAEIRMHNGSGGGRIDFLLGV